MSGFVVIRREALDHPVIGEAERFRAWCWLIANACWKPTRVRIKGAVIELERGELSFSQRFLAENWGWSKSRVDRFICELRDAEMIETRQKERGNSGATTGAKSNHKAGQGACIITICNYEKYQSPQKSDRGKVEPQSGASANQKRGEEEQENKIIPLPNGNGAGDFWTFAVGYLGEGRRSLIGKWRRDYSPAEVINAIASAQFASAVDPVSYIEKTLRRQKADAEEVPLV